MTPLEDLFPLEDYRFHLTLRRGELREFFAPSLNSETILAERRRWLSADGKRYADLQPEGRDAFERWTELVASWGIRGGSCAELGGMLEPDFLLLTRQEDGEFRLRGGALVFPTSWALQEKLGQTLDSIHDVVPGLNDALAPTISRFLNKLRPDGPGYLRSNWGMAATPALNLHPSQPRALLTADLDPADVWVRVEDQILAGLIEDEAIVFGIRIEQVPLRHVLDDPRLREGLLRALTTMPDALAEYKGLAAARPRLCQVCARGAGERD